MSSDLLVLGRQVRGRTENIWNVFVQILVPLVIVLSFIAVIDVARYQAETRATKRENALLAGELQNVMNRPEVVSNLMYKRTVIMNQRLRLQKALTDIVVSRRRDFGLDRFRDGSSVRLRGIRIDDVSFAETTLMIEGNLEIRNERRDFQDEIYADLLEQTGINDPEMDQTTQLTRSARVRPWSDKEQEIPEEACQTDQQIECFTAQEDVIWPANRAFVHNEIISATQRMLDDLARLQGTVLERIYDALLEEPEELDDYARDLVRQMIDPQTSTEHRLGSVREFRRYQAEGLKRRLVADGYPFLERTWEQVIGSL